MIGGQIFREAFYNSQAAAAHRYGVSILENPQNNFLVRHVVSRAHTTVIERFDRCGDLADAILSAISHLIGGTAATITHNTIGRLYQLPWKQSLYVSEGFKHTALIALFTCDLIASPIIVLVNLIDPRILRTDNPVTKRLQDEIDAITAQRDGFQREAHDFNVKRNALFEEVKIEASARNAAEERAREVETELASLREAMSQTA